MIHLFYSHKGGSGTTVTAAATALALARSSGRAVLIDLCGDAPAALGMAEPPGPGINEWLDQDSTADGESLLLLGSSADNGLVVIHQGCDRVNGNPRWSDLTDVLLSLPMPVVIDAGTRPVPPEMHERSQRSLLVTRPCYMSLRRAINGQRPDGIVLIEEPGRALTSKDIASVLSLPVVANIPFESAISRAVDAGLLASRLPQLLQRHLPLA